ncbi:MAG: hypothetical protein HY553_21555, partial [Elusimicrobia bacterium]|nr:hypothetical protein [Elusimicrobiota bacterium]
LHHELCLARFEREEYPALRRDGLAALADHYRKTGSSALELPLRLAQVEAAAPFGPEAVKAAEAERDRAAERALAWLRKPQGGVPADDWAKMLRALERHHRERGMPLPPEVAEAKRQIFGSTARALIDLARGQPPGYARSAYLEQAEAYAGELGDRSLLDEIDRLRRAPQAAGR